jgi:hypothetical protein
VNRPATDNDLLAACERAHRAIAIAAGFGLFVCVGASWWLLVALRAGGEL